MNKVFILESARVMAGKRIKLSRTQWLELQRMAAFGGEHLDTDLSSLEGRLAANALKRVRYGEWPEFSSPADKLVLDEVIELLELGAGLVVGQRME